jgi:hypothetical protein
MQPVSESRFVLHHVKHVNHLNKLRCYHCQQPERIRKHRDIQHFHLHDRDHLKTPEAHAT